MMALFQASTPPTWDEISAFLSSSPLPSILSLCISLIAFVFTFYVHFSRRTWTRNATFQRVHEKLVDARTASGRREIIVRGKESRFPAPPVGPPADDEENAEEIEAPLWDKMNEAAAWYDTLGTYLQLGQVSRRVTLAAWHHPLEAIRPAMYKFLDHRRNYGIEQPWSALRYLLEESHAYTCKCDTCKRLRSSGIDRLVPDFAKDGRCECYFCTAKRTVSEASDEP